MLPRLARVLRRLHQQDERHGEAQHEHRCRIEEPAPIGRRYGQEERRAECEATDEEPRQTFAAPMQFSHHHLICGAGTPAFRYGAEASSPLCGILVLCVRHSGTRQSNGFSTHPALRTPECTVSLRRCSGREPGSGPRGRTGSVVTPPSVPKVPPL